MGLLRSNLLNIYHQTQVTKSIWTIFFQVWVYSTLRLVDRFYKLIQILIHIHICISNTMAQAISVFMDPSMGGEIHRCSGKEKSTTYHTPISSTHMSVQIHVICWWLYVVPNWGAETYYMHIAYFCFKVTTVKLSHSTRYFA